MTESKVRQAVDFIFEHKREKHDSEEIIKELRLAIRPQTLSRKLRELAHDGVVIPTAIISYNGIKYRAYRAGSNVAYRRRWPKRK
jgi:hypothetical protein